MFEITYCDADKLQEYIRIKKAYADAVYDFTFENRFLVYHCMLCHRFTYIALDMKTGQGSEITCVHPDKAFKKHQHHKMIPQILYSIKYTGDRRNFTNALEDPYDAIESIFRTVLPSYGYTVREEQIALAKKMYLGFARKKVTICEAEVGTGKTMAYLVASFMARRINEAQYNREVPITISTSSIELQYALMEKEIPKLSKMLLDFGIISRPLRAVLRKGKEHYFCQCRYEDFLRSVEQTPEKHSKQLSILARPEIRRKLCDLDRTGLPTALKTRICVKGSCKGCAYAEECNYQRYIKGALRDRYIDFQITNHNMFLASYKRQKGKDGNLLQESCFAVVDEAHKFKEAAVDTFGESLHQQEISKYLNTVRRLAGKKVDPCEYEQMVNSVEAFNKKLFAPLRRRIDSQEESSVSLEGMTPMMRSLFQKLKNGISWIEGHRKPMQPYVENRASHIFQALEMLEKYGKGRLLVVMDEAEMISLQYAPKNVGSVLEDKVWSMPVSFVLTSGTVSDEGDFEHFLNENGLQRISKQRLLTYCVPSPFCYEQHTRLYIPNDMPFPDCDSSEYIEAVAARIASLVKATNGHTAVLFTSYKLLNAVYESIQGRLGHYNIFCMTRNNKNAIQDFRNSPNGVLFASGAMWEGVDFAGDCLSSVIIPRLPFPIRGGMSQQKKEQYKDAQDFIWKYVVPEMVTKLRQGVGRLIRTETDTGVVSILDVRAYQGMYKDKVAGVLQKYPVIHSVEEVQRFFQRVKPQEYFDDEA